jgi:hypothetical protein
MSQSFGIHRINCPDHFARIQQPRRDPAIVNQDQKTAIIIANPSESGATSNETFTVTLSDHAGLLSATGAGVSEAGTTALTITGSLGQMNSDLATLTDTDPASAPDTITTFAGRSHSS